MNDIQLKAIKELCANYTPVERSSWFGINFWNGDENGRTECFDAACSVRDFNRAYLDGNFLVYITDNEDEDGQEPWNRCDVSGITDILVDFWVYSSSTNNNFWDERDYIVKVDGSVLEMTRERMTGGIKGPAVLAHMQLSSGSVD